MSSTPSLPYTMNTTSSILINFDDKDEDDRIEVGQTIATLSVQDVESGVTSDVDLVVASASSSVEAFVNGVEYASPWRFIGLRTMGKQGQLSYGGSGEPSEVILKNIDFYW